MLGNKNSARWLFIEKKLKMLYNATGPSVLDVEKTSKNR